jgi:hypothetical protein
MRIVWKDSGTPRGAYKPIRYRKHTIEGYVSEHLKGWTIDIPGDCNIYATNYDAMNAIDKAIGGTSVRNSDNRKRKGYGIKIIGKKSNESA